MSELLDRPLHRYSRSKCGALVLLRGNVSPLGEGRRILESQFQVQTRQTLGEA